MCVNMIARHKVHPLILGSQKLQLSHRVLFNGIVEWVNEGFSFFFFGANYIPPGLDKTKRFLLLDSFKKKKKKVKGTSKRKSCCIVRSHITNNIGLFILGPHKKQLTVW